MATVKCARCGEDREGLPAAPWPGPSGEEIRDHVCLACWRAWQVMQTKVINEFRLNLGDAKDAETLDLHMKVYLGLADPEALPEAPYGYGEGGPEGTGEG